MQTDVDLKRPYAMEDPFGSVLKWLPPVTGVPGIKLRAELLILLKRKTSRVS